MVPKSLALIVDRWSHGVMVSTLDFESSDPSSNLGGTLVRYASFIEKLIFASTFRNICILSYHHITLN